MWKTLLPFIKNWRRKASTCYSLSFWWWPFWQAWGRISLWLWFAFPQQLAMLSIFSCTCWPSVCVLWKNLFQVLCPFFNWFFSFFFSPWCWVVWVLCVFWILTSYQIYHLPLSSLFQLLSDSPSKPCSWRK